MVANNPDFLSPLLIRIIVKYKVILRFKSDQLIFQYKNNTTFYNYNSHPLFRIVLPKNKNGIFHNIPFSHN